MVERLKTEKKKERKTEKCFHQSPPAGHLWDTNIPSFVLVLM